MSESPNNTPTFCCHLACPVKSQHTWLNKTLAVTVSLVATYLLLFRSKRSPHWSLASNSQTCQWKPHSINLSQTLLQRYSRAVSLWIPRFRLAVFFHWIAMFNLTKKLQSFHFQKEPWSFLLEKGRLWSWFSKISFTVLNHSGTQRPLQPWLKGFDYC